MFGDGGVEAVGVVGGVVDLPDGPVSLDDAVGALDQVPVADLRVSLGVAGDGVVDGVFEIVRRVSVRDGREGGGCGEGGSSGRGLNRGCR